MHILMVAGPYIPVPPPKYGGTELIINYLIRGLMESGHTVTLLASGDSEVDCKLVPIADKAIYFPRTTKEKPAYDKQVERINTTTEKLLRQMIPSADIIHSHGFDLRNFSDVPNITTIHGPILMDQIDYYNQRSNLFYTPISNNQKEALAGLNYTRVVYNGEDPEVFPVIEQPEDYLCFIGRFDREKNPHLAIQLAIKLGMKIKVAGKIDLQGEGYFEEEVAKYFDHPLVEYLGELGFKEKVDLISRARCNLHPTGFREPFGLTVLEAAYCGTPTLAIARGSMPELIDEGFTGMLVEDFVEGYHAIEECLQMDRTYIASRTRRLFNYRNMTKGYVNAYKHVVRQLQTSKTISTNDSLEKTNKPIMSPGDFLKNVRPLKSHQ